MSKKKKIHIVSYTHWDREFRFDFETTRMWLVRLMDNLLQTMEKKTDFKHFMLDGQFTLIDDYLEIRPEKTQQIKDLVKAGRIQAGPWQTLPDSSSIYGESLIRNLMTGLKRSDEFGGAMRIGYNVFSFGQISQLPQIYAGFNIDSIVFYKHMDRSRSRYDEFMWESPDGTQALASRLGAEARWNFFFAGHIPIVYDLDPWDKNWQYKWGQMGNSFHFCEPNNYAGFHFITKPATGFYADNIKKGFQRTIDTLKDTAANEHLLFWDGTDFTEAHPMIPEIIEEARKVLGDEYEIEHSTLQEYFEAIKPILKDKDLDVINGHMKDGPVGSVHTDVLSVHPELKKANSLAENLLFRVAEPFSAAAWLLGHTYPRTHIDKTLMYLFKSQAHDSLHGVGPANMSAGVEYNLLQAKVIAENIVADSLQYVAAKINTSEIKDADLFLTVFNPSAFKRSEVLEAYIDVPQEWNVEELILESSDGSEIEIYELQRQQGKAGIYHPRSRNMPMYINRFRVLFLIKDVPALGYETIKVKYKKLSIYPYPHEDFDAVKIPYAPLAKDTRNAENEFVMLTIADDGTLEVENKITERVYKKLNYFIDTGQNGNQQRCYPPKIDRVITTLGQPAKISLVINNTLMAKFVIETQMVLPKFFDKVKNIRSDEEVVLPIKSEIILRKNSPIIEVETTVDNNVKDHFLKVGFETGIKTDYTYAGSVFDVEAFSTRPTQNGKWQGPQLRRHQQHGFMDISDDKEGLAILNDYLRDYEVTDHTNGTVVQSIVRSVELRIPCDNRLWMEYPGDDSTQSLRTHTVRYGIYAHTGNWEKANVCKDAVAFNTPMRIAQIASQKGTLAVYNSFLEIANSNLILSAFKKAENNDSVILRVYNPTKTEITSQIIMQSQIEQAWLTNLNEDRLRQLEVTDNHNINLKVDAKKIITVEFIVNEKEITNEATIYQKEI